MNPVQIFALGVSAGALIALIPGFVLGWNTRDHEVRNDGRQAR
jgi:hypothetical protein